MKKILFIVLLFLAFKSQAQTDLLTKDTLANNENFKTRVRSATVIAANQIAADVAQPYYSLQYANLIISNPNGGWIDGMTHQVVSNPVIDYNSPDDAIQFTVNSNFDKVAKAQFNILPPPKDTTKIFDIRN